MPPPVVALTPNAVMTIAQQAEQVQFPSAFCPVLQITQLKPVGDARYRAVLSDGTHFVQGMLAQQLNSLATDGNLQNSSVIRMLKFLKNIVNGKLLVILLEAQILDNPGFKIGTPVDIEKVRDNHHHHNAAAAAAPKPAAGVQPLYNSTNSNPYSQPTAASSPSARNNPYGGASSFGGQQQQQQQQQQSSAPIVRSDNVSNIGITPIAALNIYNSRWTIKARLTEKSEIRTWSNAKGDGSLFSIELLDSSGDIRGTFFKEAVDKFYHQLDVGQVYRISGGRLKVANMQYNNCKSAFEITFDMNTEIHLDTSSDDVVRQQYQFCKIASIEGIDANKSIDVLAVVKQVGDVARIISKKSGQEMLKCDLTLVDDSNAEITLTLWQKKAETAPAEFANQPVVAFRRARVSDYGGKSLSAGGAYEINPPEYGRALQTWWQPAAGVQPLYNSTNSNPYSQPTAASSPSARNNPYGGASSFGGQQQQQQQQQQSSAPIVRSDNVSNIGITPIAALNIYNSRWTIKARLTEKSEIRTWSNAKGDGSLFSIELLDSSGDIRGTFFKEAVDKFYHQLDVGQVYRISGGRLKVANMQYNNCKSAFEITFDMNTEIHLDTSSDDVVRQQYQFCKIASIEGIDANKSIDVLAVVKQVGDVARIISKKSGQEMLKCDLTLVDDSNAEITLTLWQKKAETAPAEFANQPVVAFRRARVSDYGGKSLSAGGAYEINPPEYGRALQTWWQQGSHAPSKSLSAAAAGGGGFGRKPAFCERKSIGAIKDENLGHTMDKGDYISFKAHLVFIKKDKEGGAWYTACPNAGEPCKNRFKVTPTTDGQWQCDKCQGTYPNCVRRWIFSGVVEDETSSTWVSFFNEQAETLLGGVTADEAYQSSFSDQVGHDQDAYNSIFAPAMFSEWVFTCKVKNELVNDEARIKTSVASMWPVDYVQEAKDMLAAIETF